MKIVLFVLSVLLIFTNVCYAQTTVRTIGNNSPAVVATDISIEFNIRPEAVNEILNVYRAKGLSLEQTREAARSVLNKFNSTIRRSKSKKNLSIVDRKRLGISNDKDIISALDWQIFTSGINSPAIFSNGDVNIWYGIPKDAFISIYNVLDSQQLKIDRIRELLRNEIVRYNNMIAILNQGVLDEKSRLEIRKLLDHGRINEADTVIQKIIQKNEQQTERKNRESAEMLYIGGGIKELLFQFDTAYSLYEKAIAKDKSNKIYWEAAFNISIISGKIKQAIQLAKKYLVNDQIDHNDSLASLVYFDIATAYLILQNHDSSLAYFNRSLNIAITHKEQSSLLMLSRILNGLATYFHTYGKYDTAIKYYYRSLNYFAEKAKSNFDSLVIADIYGNLGDSYLALNNFDSAFYYQNNAFIIDSMLYYKYRSNNKITFSAHSDLALRYNSLSGIAFKLGNLDKARELLEQSYSIDSAFWGIYHYRTANRIRNQAWLYSQLGDYSKALLNVRKALEIDYLTYDSLNSNIADDYQLLANIYSDKEGFDKGALDTALYYIKIAYSIDTSLFGIMYPSVGMVLYTMGGIYLVLRNSEAYQCFNIAKKIFLKFPLDPIQDRTFQHGYNASQIMYAYKFYVDSNFDKARDLLELACDQCLASRDTTLYGFGMFNLIKILFVTNRFELAFTKCNTAINYFEDFLRTNPVKLFADFEPQSFYKLLQIQKAVAIYKIKNEKEGLQMLSDIKDNAVKINDMNTLQYLATVQRLYSVN